MKSYLYFALITVAVAAQTAHANTSPRLHSTYAMVVDAETHEVLLDKDGATSAPMASVTKLLTAMVALDANPDLEETLSVSYSDVDTVKRSSSRVSVGTELSRKDMLHLALMSSENRTASALSRYYDGGQPAFINAMNAKARRLGMTSTRVQDATGLSPENRSSAQDLVRMVLAADQYRPIRQYTTSSSYKVSFGERLMSYKNTNPLVGKDNWDIGLSKTGYTKEAGRCIVLKMAAAGKDLIVVLLGSNSSSARMADIQSIKRWVGGEVQLAEAQPYRRAAVAPDYGKYRLSKAPGTSMVKQRDFKLAKSVGPKAGKSRSPKQAVSAGPKASKSRATRSAKAAVLKASKPEKSKAAKKSIKPKAKFSRN